MFLRKGAWVQVKITPKHAVVAPGGIARFEVGLRGKGEDRTAIAGVDGGEWPSGLQLGTHTARRGEGVALNVPKDGTQGVLEVHVPSGVETKTRQTIEVEATPLQDGEAMPKRRGHAKVTVQAGLPSNNTEGGELQVHLVNIQHDPARPVAGGTVLTTATLQNDGATSAHMRVVLMLDGKAVKEENIEIPAAGSRQVRLPWTATNGPTRVKVQAFLA
jgi:hypothetical protein